MLHIHNSMTVIYSLMLVVLQMHAVSIHTNVVGGMTMSEPANDLAIAVAIASSYYEQPIARDIVCIGEVGACSSLTLAAVTPCTC